jgi:hypothetical protein
MFLWKIPPENTGKKGNPQESWQERFFGPKNKFMKTGICNLAAMVAMAIAIAAVAAMGTAMATVMVAVAAAVAAMVAAMAAAMAAATTAQQSTKRRWQWRRRRL